MYNLSTYLSIYLSIYRHIYLYFYIYIYTLHVNICITRFNLRSRRLAAAVCSNGGVRTKAVPTGGEGA